jgi:hypothetical protein
MNECGKGRETFERNVEWLKAVLDVPFESPLDGKELMKESKQGINDARKTSRPLLIVLFAKAVARLLSAK